jgi:hypothetical protein
MYLGYQTYPSPTPSVRIIKIKEIFGKADEIIHSKEVYKVTKVNKNSVTLDNDNNYKSR